MKDVKHVKHVAVFVTVMMLGVIVFAQRGGPTPEQQAALQKLIQTRAAP